MIYLGCSFWRFFFFNSRITTPGAKNTSDESIRFWSLKNPLNVQLEAIHIVKYCHHTRWCSFFNEYIYRRTQSQAQTADILQPWTQHCLSTETVTLDWLYLAVWFCTLTSQYQVRLIFNINVSFWWSQQIPFAYSLLYVLTTVRI